MVAWADKFRFEQTAAQVVPKELGARALSPVDGC